MTDVQPLTNGSIALRRCDLCVVTSPGGTEIGVKNCKVETVKPVAPE